MGKALKTAGVIIGAAALIATGVGALAMPGLAGATTLMGVSTGTLNTISSGLVAVGGMLDKPKSQGSAQPDEWTSNPDQPIPFLFGRMGVAGKIVQRDEFGPDNMYQGIVGIISGAGPIKGIQSFKGDDQAVTFGANGIAVTSQWQGEMWMVRRAGNQPDTVLSVPSGLKSGGTGFQWSSSARLSGKACYLQILGENSKGTAYPAGIPDPVHVGEGVYGYDPRYDSTYPGGDGPCRLGVRSTYRYIDDPIIAGLNWALGMVENGQVVGGIGASPDGIDMPAFVECANISEANGWKVAAWPDTSEDASSVLDQFLQAGGAVRARHAGKISCVPRGAPRASVVTVTARDMAGPIELNAAPSLFDQLNTITPRFMSEAAGWKLTPANPVSFAQYVTDDGGKHSDQIDYRFVPLVKQAAELAAYDILDAREPFSGSVPLKPHMRQLKRGDCFVIDNPGVLLDVVKCIVLSRSYDPKTAEVRISFRSETDGKHALALGKTTTLPDFPVLTPTDPTYVSPPLPEDWVIVPRPPGGGPGLPGFDLSGVVGNDTATAIQVEFWVVPGGIDPYLQPPANADWQSAGTWPPTASTIPVDVPPDRYYWVGLIYIRGQNYSTRARHGPYFSGELVASDTINFGSRPVSEVLEQIDGNSARIDEVQEQADDALESAVTTLNLALGQLDGRVDDIDLDINNPSTGLKVRVGQAEQVANDAASRVTAVELEVDGFSSSIATLEQATVDLAAGKADASRVSALEAVARAQGSLPSTFIDQAASGYRRLASGAPGGASVPSALMNQDADAGWTYLTTSNTTILFDQAVQNVDGDVWKVGARIRGNSVTNTARLYYYALNKDYVAQSSGYVPISIPPTGTIDYSVTMGPGGNIALPPVSAAAQMLRFGVSFLIAGGGARMIWLRADNVTDVAEMAASVTALESAVVDLENSKAEASVVTGISAEILGARNGSVDLGAQLTSMRQATTDGLAEKATTTEVNTLRSEVQTARNGSATLGAQLTTMRQTVSDGLAGKAGATDFNSLKAEVTTARGTASSLNSRLDTVQADVNGKASASRVTLLEAEAEDIRSDLQVTMGVAADAAEQIGSAFFEILAASGDVPAQLAIKSGDGTSIIGLAAASIILKNVINGNIVEAMKLVNGEAHFGAPVSVLAGTRRLTIGAGFGSGSSLVLWFGPSATAISSMTRTNGYFALGTDGKVYYGSSELGGAGFTAKTNSSWITGSRSGAGNITTPAAVISVNGGAGTITYRWWFISGDASLAIGTTSGGASATWQTNLPSSPASKQAVWGWAASTATESASGVVQVLAQTL